MVKNLNANKNEVHQFDRLEKPVGCPIKNHTIFKKQSLTDIQSEEPASLDNSNGVISCYLYITLFNGFFTLH